MNLMRLQINLSPSSACDLAERCNALQGLLASSTSVFIPKTGLLEYSAWSFESHFQGGFIVINSNTAIARDTPYVDNARSHDLA
jgi:hypothetical protein